MTLAQLQTFLTIARLGSFRAAAEELHLTQPTLSVRIRSLEEDLRVRLFERSGHKVHLTVDGWKLLGYAERMIMLAEELRANAGSPNMLDGVLRLGAVDSFGLTWLPRLLWRLNSEFPKLKVDLTIDHSIHLMRKLSGSELDLAFLVDPAVNENIIAEPICQLEYAWVASPKIPLPDDVLSPRDLVELPVITVAKPSRSYAFCLEWFASEGVEPRRLSFCNSLNMIAPLVVAGFGITILPRCLVEEHLRDGALRELRTSPKAEPNTLSVALRANGIRSGLGTIVSMAHEVVAGNVSRRASTGSDNPKGERRPIRPL